MSALKRLPHSRFIAVTMLMLLMLLLFITFINADVGKLQVEWQQFLPGIRGKAVVQTSDGGYLVLGINATLSEDPESGEFVYANTTDILVKTDSNGRVVWTRTLPFDPNRELNFLISTNDGGYALAGILRTEVPIDYGGGLILDQNKAKFYLMKVDSAGNELWTKVYERENDLESLRLAGLIYTNDGGFALVGTFDFPQGVPFIWLVKTNNTGNLEWSKKIDTEDYTRASDILQMNEGDYMILGHTGYKYGPKSLWVIKVDSSGNQQWSQKYVYPTAYWCYSTVGTLTSDRECTICGYITFDSGDSYAWIINIDYLGNVLWNRTYGERNSRFYSIVQATDGGYVFSGLTGNNESGISKGLVAKIDSVGNVEKQIEFPGINPDSINYPMQIIKANDGGYVVVGSWNSDIVHRARENERFWLVKFAPTPTSSPSTPSATSTPSTTLTPTPTPSQEPQQTEFTTITGIAIVVAVLGAGLGLLIYLIKRK